MAAAGGPEPAPAAAGGGGAADGGDGEARRFEVKKWNSVAFWKWDVQQERCAICRNSIYEPSIENQSQGLQEINNAWGACNHCYHLECISRWLKSNNVCPLCGAEWEISKIQKLS